MTWCQTSDETTVCLYLFEIFSVSSWHHPHNEHIHAMLQFVTDYFHMWVKWGAMSLTGFVWDSVGAWRLKRATEASGAPGRAAEGAASCLTVCWTDYSLIAVDVKADEVITWPMGPHHKVNPPCVYGGGCSMLGLTPQCEERESCIVTGGMMPTQLLLLYNSTT